MKSNEQTENDKIVVLAAYPTAIEANLAKTKLDAYGIPCFLTDENLANIYPLSYFRAGQVRLHIFAQDVEQAKEILTEEKGTE